MTKDDLKLWARHIYLKKLEPSMSNLLIKMDGQGNGRSASLRSSNSQNWLPHSLIRQHSGYLWRHKSKNQCYVCKANYYVDECPRFQAMIQNERWEVVKGQKACFSLFETGLRPHNRELSTHERMFREKWRRHNLQ